MRAAEEHARRHFHRNSWLTMKSLFSWFTFSEDLASDPTLSKLARLNPGAGGGAAAGAFFARSHVAPVHPMGR